MLNWRSMLSRTAGGAETHCHEIFKRIAQKNSVHLIASCDDKYRPKNVVVDKIRVYHVTTNEMLYPVFSLFSFLRYFPKRFDVVVEDVSKFPMVWPLIFSRLLNKPFLIIVHHVHGKTLFEEFPMPLSGFFYFLELFGLKLYTLFRPHVVVVSKSTKRELVLLGFSEEKTKVIYNGLDLDFTQQSHEKKAPYPLIVYFGRVKKYKRLEHLISAARQVSQKIKNARVIVAGKGDAKIYAELSVRAKELGLSGVVEFRGEVSEGEKKSILRKAWVYAISSMKEGFGISVIEAQTFGVPVVAYDVPGLRDSIKHSVSGFLVKNGDINAFADKLIMIC
ncbi:MAG: glycosyltransferase family 4 protein, partial [Candidatus Bathyarchaeales archaeon]